MSRLLRRYPHTLRLLVLAIVCVFGGGHLLLGQAIAWSIMLAQRSQTMPVAEAFDSTFSGEAPCLRCCQIREVAKETQLPQGPKSSGDQRGRIGFVLAEALPPLSDSVPAPGLLGDSLITGRDAVDVIPWLLDRSLEMPPWV